MAGGRGMSTSNQQVATLFAQEEASAHPSPLPGPSPSWPGGCSHLPPQAPAAAPSAAPCKLRPLIVLQLHTAGAQWLSPPRG